MRIAVLPARGRLDRARLFDALEETLPVRFIAAEPDGDLATADAAVVLPDAGQPAGVPAGLPRLVALAEESPSGVGAQREPTGRRVALGADAPLDRRLRGWDLREGALPARPGVAVRPSQVVLAVAGADAVWASDPAPGRRRDVVAVAPAELTEAECLRDRLRDGRFLALAALVHFVRAVCAPTGWRPPPLRACFLFDDPNLHWRSYGHLRYEELVRQADAGGYHVAFATVPLDGWLVHPRTARLFRQRADRLSLVVHGNDHAPRELARPAAPAERRALLAQALRRVERFERRAGVSVGRIMVAPHGVCSQEMARDLVPLGFEALCISRPFPWLALPPRSWLAHPPGTSALTGWEPASLVDDGLPVLLRQALSEPVEDLPLRALLDQPLILYGHHADVAGGLDRLAELASLIGRMGEVRWMSPADIAASNVTTRREGDVLRARLFTRRARLEIPAGVARVVVETPALTPRVSPDVLRWRVAGAPAASGVLAVSPGREAASLDVAAGAVEIGLLRGDATDVAAVAEPARRHRMIARRLITEARDRLMPLYRQMTRVLVRG